MTNSDQTEQPKKSPKKLFVIIGVAVVLLAAVTGISTVLLGSSEPAAATEEAGEKALEPGEIVSAGEITVGLKDTSAPHYLRTDISIQLTAEANVEFVSQRTAVALDAAISHLSALTFSEAKALAVTGELSTGISQAVKTAFNRFPEAENAVIGVLLTSLAMQ